MAEAVRYVCGGCYRAIEAWSDGNPYYLDDDGIKHYAYHPDHERLDRCKRQGEFHVGTTKILHFMNPKLFIIVDSNAARAFKLSHRVNFRNTTQPGYSMDKYVECMEHARMDILNFGVDKFCALEKGVPIARIYDKLTFMTGSKKP